MSLRYNGANPAFLGFSNTGYFLRAIAWQDVRSLLNCAIELFRSVVPSHGPSAVGVAVALLAKLMAAKTSSNVLRRSGSPVTLSIGSFVSSG